MNDQDWIELEEAIEHNDDLIAEMDDLVFATLERDGILRGVSC